ncbi:6-phosphogluconate dehydrogenase decarboxylating [Gracilaria domingensis]|nr:6-phosphogluconate dehydrogenase decarboxylating [Gracilaria domingensis]
MLGGPKSAWELVKPMMEKISTQVDDGPCVTYIGPEGSGNYVNMVHNGIDMQLVGEANDLLRKVAGLSMEKISDVFEQWNAAELQSFLIEITAKILRQKDDVVKDRSYLVNNLLNQTGSKALKARFIFALKKHRELALDVLEGPAFSAERNPNVKKQIVADVRKTLYASKICSYAKSMNIIRSAGVDGEWGLNLGAIFRIWNGGFLIRAKILDRIHSVHDRDATLFYSSQEVQDYRAIRSASLAPFILRVHKSC